MSDTAATQLLAGVDVGGTKMAVGLADREGRIIASLRADTTREGGPQVISQIIGLCQETLREAGVSQDRVRALGVAVPAVIDQARGAVLWAPNIVGWQQEVVVTGPIGQALGIPVTLHYDGHAWVTGEWWCGAARGARHVALVAVGTGIGGGLILGGRLHRGHVGVAGAMGWWAFDRSRSHPARPASQGWLESLASGPAIARAAGKASAEEALRAARAGDTAACAAVAYAAEVLGLAVANLVSLVDPEMVVLAGGVIAGEAELLLPRVREIVAAQAQPQMARAVRVVAAELGEDAAWLGAARLSLGAPGEEEVS